MDYLQVALSSAASIFVLFVFAKIVGNRQMSQLSLFDYITGITIGSIAAEMAISGDLKMLIPLTAIAVYTVTSWGISIITDKSIPFRRFFDGTACIIFDSGKLYKYNMKKNHLGMDEFLTLCRNQGYFNLSEIQTAILEDNGKLSILPAVISRPATVGDLNLQIEQEKPPVTVIIDGEVIFGNLKYVGKDEKWLKNKLSEQKISKIKEVFLATCDDKNNLSVYTKKDDAPVRDIFQ